MVDLLGRWEVLAALVLGGLAGPLLLRLLRRLLHDRRLAPRRWGDPREVRLARPEAGGPEIHGLVINRSPGGVGLLLDEAVPVGVRLRLRLVGVPADVPWLAVQVKHCRAAGLHWFIGCEFGEPPPRNVLAWFG
jgi:hypothetical protein